MKLCGTQKLPNLFGECTITENVDGLVAAIHIAPHRNLYPERAVWNTASQMYEDASPAMPSDTSTVAARKGVVYRVAAIAGKRYVTPKKDNHGFAAWVHENADELVKLGPGKHVGRWWGRGINRNYNLDERRFSLINYARWSGPNKPDCVHVLPMLYKGPFSTGAVARVADALRLSYAAPEFGGSPFGLIVYHHGINNMFKVNL